MALTNYWFDGPSGWQDSAGSWVLTRPPFGSYCGIREDSFWATAHTVRLTIGSFTQDWPAPVADNVGTRLNLPFTTGAIPAGTPCSVSLIGHPLGSVTISGSLPQAISGTSYLRTVIGNGFWDDDYYQYVEFGWGGTDAYTLGDLRLEDGSTPPSGGPAHLFRTKIISPSVQGSY